MNFNKVDLGETFESLYDLRSHAGSLYAYGKTNSKNGIVRISLTANSAAAFIVNRADIDGFDSYSSLGSQFLFKVGSSETYDSLWAIEENASTAVQLAEDLSPYEWLPGVAIEHDELLYFSASRSGGLVKTELWVTDGTPENTRLYKQLDSEGRGSYPNSFFLHGDNVYFYTDSYEGRSKPTLHVLGESPETTLPYKFDESVFQKRHFK